SPTERKSTRAYRSKVIATTVDSSVKGPITRLCPRVDPPPPAEDESVLGHGVDCTGQGEERADAQDVLQDDVPSDDERPDLAAADVRFHTSIVHSGTITPSVPVVTKMPAPHMCPTPSSVMSKVLRQRRSFVCHPYKQSNPRHQCQLSDHENVDEQRDGG
ncbi:hypothetical protein PENTCL1PPCAC_5245, partial [Pristionchus entomophagus]